MFRDVPGQRSLSRDFWCCSCPGTKGRRDNNFFLSRDKGTTGRPVLDCPGTSRGTSHPLETLIDMDLTIYFSNFIKVQIFWEGRTNLAHLPLFIGHYLVVSNYKWKMNLFCGLLRISKVYDRKVFFFLWKFTSMEIRMLLQKWCRPIFATLNEQSYTKSELTLSFSLQLPTDWLCTCIQSFIRTTYLIYVVDCYISTFVEFADACFDI